MMYAHSMMLLLLLWNVTYDTNFVAHAWIELNYKLVHIQSSIRHSTDQPPPLFLFISTLFMCVQLQYSKEEMYRPNFEFIIV